MYLCHALPCTARHLSDFGMIFEIVLISIVIIEQILELILSSYYFTSCKSLYNHTRKQPLYICVYQQHL